MGEDIVAIFKDTDGLDRRIGRHVLNESGHAGRARSYLQVVLYVFIRIDIREWHRVFGLKRLQEIDYLLFTGKYPPAKPGALLCEPLKAA
jgi:hypothetical protein